MLPVESYQRYPDYKSVIVQIVYSSKSVQTLFTTNVNAIVIDIYFE